MNFLKLSLIVVAVSLVMNGAAQTASVETASLSLKTYKKENTKKDLQIHSLNEAKKHVDMAVNNPSTSNDPKMWLMRSRTYLYIYTDKNGEGEKSIIKEPDAIKIAVESMVNCHKADEKEKYSRSSDGYNAFVEIAVHAKYIADVAYNNKEYDKSVEYYGLILKLFPYDDQSLLKRQNISADGLLFTWQQLKNWEATMLKLKSTL